MFVLPSQTKMFGVAGWIVLLLAAFLSEFRSCVKVEVAVLGSPS